MERSEPTLVPEWLKSSGSLSGGGNTAHQFASSSFHSDDLKSGRNRSLGNSSDNDLGRSSFDRTTSSYFRRTSSSNGSAHLRSHSSFGRSHRDKDWDRDAYEFRDREKSVLGDNRHRDYSDPLGNILPTRFEKDGLRRSHSSISGKHGDSWPRKLAADLTNTSKSNHSNGSALHTGGGSLSSVQKSSFEKDFPSLGAEERHNDPDIGRVPSPGLTTAIQSLPIGNSAVIGGDGWTSALAEVPVIVASTPTSAASGHQAVHANSVPVTSSVMTGRNMAETLAQGPPRTQAVPQLSVGTQRLEELAVKQSRQLIPVTPSLPKALALNPSDKQKPKIGQPQNSLLVNHSPRSGPVKPEVPKTSSLGKLHVLKPSRERNGISSTAKDSLSPTSNNRLSTNSPLSIAPTVVGSTPLRNPSNNPVLAGIERKPPVVLLEKRPSVHAQSRNDFFNSMRKKSMINSSSTLADSGSSVSTCVLDKPSETEADVPVPHGRGEPQAEVSGGDHQTCAYNDVLISNGEAYDGLEKSLNSGKSHARYTEEEEAALLRSMGWDENAGEDEGLTEEEISAFYRDASKYVNSNRFSRILQGAQLGNSAIGGISSDSKLQS